MHSITYFFLLTVNLYWLVPCNRISTDIGATKLYIVHNITSLSMPYFWHERKKCSVSSNELPQYWQDRSSFKKSSYKCAFKLLALFLSWQCITFSLLVQWSNSLFFFGKVLLSFDLNKATEKQSLVPGGNSFQALIVDGRKLL